MALTSQLVTFKSWWLSPKEVQIRLYRQTPLPSKRGSPASHLRCLRRDRADRRRDEDRQASSAADRDVEGLSDTKKEASRGTCGSSLLRRGHPQPQYGPAVLDLRQSVVPWLAQVASYCEARDSVRHASCRSCG